MSASTGTGSHRSILGDASGISNTRASSRARRKSFCVSDRSSNQVDTPSNKSDRRALLAEWRKQTRGTSSAGSDNTARIPTSEDYNNKKRNRFHEAPPLPPSAPSASSNAVAATDGISARERLQLRKQQKRLHQSTDSPNQTPPMPTKSTIDFYDDEEENASVGSRRLVGRSPLIRKSLGGARRKSLSFSARRGRASPLVPQPVGDYSQATISSSTRSIRKTPPIDLDQSIDDDVETMEEKISLRSRMKEMQQRVDQLEKEKIDLSMSKAPLENRFREKEEAWQKEQTRLYQEIDALALASKEADERYRDLEVKYEAKHEECKQLRHAVRKASSSVHSSQAADNSTWSRQLQNDRDVAELREKLRHVEEEIESIRLAKASIESELHGTKIELEALMRNFEELQREYEEIATSTSENKEAEIKLEILTTTHIATSAQLNAVREDLAATKARSDAVLEAKDEEHRKEVEKLKFDMSVLKTRAGKVTDNDDSMCEAEVEDEAVLRARIEERDRKIAELEAQLLKGEQVRRQMHNRIQELRGNIRVFVRTRPFLPGDQQTSDSSIEVSPDGESLSIADKRNGSPHDFRFDKVFPPSAGQDQVFSEVSDFVQSALDGYNVCLFSYGQTGSGKTHTMQGSGNGAMRGIIPRAVEQILDQARTSRAQNWEFKMSASFLEIYNEELKDLLSSMKQKVSNQSNNAKLAIKRSKEGRSFVDGLTEVAIETEDSDAGMRQLEALMAVAARARSVASTKMNAQSSRSHSVFMLHLRGYNKDNGAIMEGTLNLCDLAGSERLDRSGAATDAKRLRETQAINKSLSCLGDVFTALSQRSSHIPYRNSKLTYLLQDCLSGDGKAMMFVNLSPTRLSSGESLCSLRFATRVNSVELGKAKKHIQYNSRK
ncbi:Kinesin-like protein KIN [Seminavis robusta]|uniref:Kinesin-like protein n=1 Tax=Seminavis robusta TaxID=568900 RepID=A0A9N8EJA3_9STRA|nr:Kinesin-like protein KIN [Seminavis robusta]|eukprot:Sro1231_g254650.1 Kinesin-like protein KIN (893) ;mRNA; f:26585-29356